MGLPFSCNLRSPLYQLSCKTLVVCCVAQVVPVKVLESPLGLLWCPLWGTFPCHCSDPSLFISSEGNGSQVKGMAIPFSFVDKFVTVNTLRFLMPVNCMDAYLFYDFNSNEFYNLKFWYFSWIKCKCQMCQDIQFCYITFTSEYYHAHNACHFHISDCVSYCFLFWALWETS